VLDRLTLGPALVLIVLSATTACTRQQNPKACPNTACPDGLTCVRDDGVARCVARDAGRGDMDATDGPSSGTIGVDAPSGGIADSDPGSPDAASTPVMGSMPGPPARALVPGGTRASSRNYFVIKTLSSTPGRSTVSTSPSYRAVGGIAGSSQK